MTVQLHWPPDVVSRLSEEAREKGLSLDAYLLQAVLQQKRPDGTAAPDNAVKPEACEDTSQRIHELGKGRRLNLPLMKGTVIGSLSRRDIYDDRG